MNTVMILGWIFLILSWIIPLFIKEREHKLTIGLALSGLATGLFLGKLLTQ